MEGIELASWGFFLLWSSKAIRHFSLGESELIPEQRVVKSGHRSSYLEKKWKTFFSPLWARKETVLWSLGRSKLLRVWICFHIVFCMLSHFSRFQLLVTLCTSPPGSSVHGILQARILEWIAISSSRVSSWPREWTCVHGVTMSQTWQNTHTYTYVPET